MPGVSHSRSCPAWPRNHERNTCGLFVQDLFLIPLMRCVAVSVITGEDNHGIAILPRFTQRMKNPADVFVDTFDQPVVRETILLSRD
jgi:hypothetical protein